MQEVAVQSRQEHLVAVARVHQLRGKRPVSPFFPAAFAKPQSRGGVEFDFDNHVLDSLWLPTKLMPNFEAAIEEGEQQFGSRDEAGAAIAQWHTEFVDFLRNEGSSSSSSSTSRVKNSEQSCRRRISQMKELIFQRSGKPVQETLKCGKEELDDALQHCRVDMFENVMCLHAPVWSDCSVHLTHGFPKALIRKPHRGFTEGNIICASKLTNEFLRAFTTCDIVTAAPANSLRQCGLTETELAYYRSMSIGDHSQRDRRENKRLMEATFR